MSYPKLASLGSPAALRARLAELGLELPVDDLLLAAPESPMARPLEAPPFRLENRWCIHPMEGWDGEPDGRPSDLTRRRWRRFGESGAALIWGGEAVAVTPDGRANPNQLLIDDRTLPHLESLRRELLAAHRARFGETTPPVVGLQLTHSGRFSRPGPAAAPRILYHHPVLDRRFGLPPDHPLLTDGEIEGLVEAFVRAGKQAQEAGFPFVDLKHCHGYLGHEFLSARTRPGRYGGSFENRTRFLREIVAGLRREAPGLALAVRLSAFDWIPFRPDPERSAPGRPGPGVPEPAPEGEYCWGFGVDPAEPVREDPTEPARFLELLRDLGIRLVNLTAGSPYYNPHIQRPALFPPSDGYQPPEDPLIGCVRQIRFVRDLKRAFPDLVVVGSAYTYLQEFVPPVAQAVVREGWTDLVGLGRMVLSYHDLPADTLAGRLDPKRICRTFSDCTTAPRNGLVSGCYPLDPFYKESPLRKQLLQIKAARPGAEK